MPTRSERWDRAVQLPLTLASFAFVAAYAWPIVDPGLGRSWSALCALVVWGTWGLLVVDLVVRLVLAPDRWAFLRRHPVDVAMVVLPILRPLQLLRLFTLLKSLNRLAGSSLRGRVGIYVAGSMTLIVFIASLAVLDAERGGNGPIQTFGDALWWALVTVATVGYGDFYPVTLEGRAVAVGLMLFGIGVLGVVTAGFASWLVERVDDLDEMENGVAATAADVESLRAEIAALRADLATRDTP
ncbi:MAG: Ion transport 2 domain protein [Marmoricola sp.]|nr:Ion transport 2 domain protein [Marmoricola sp.]